MQLRRLGLALERSQARTRLALNVEGAVQVVLGPCRASAAPGACACGACRVPLLPRSASCRSRGLEVTIASTRPWEMTECISLPSPVSESTSITSTRRHRAPASRYSPSPLRSSRRKIETSGAPRFSVPSLSSRTSSTSALRPACRPGAPPKITSCIDCPRTAIGDCSPSAQRTASVTFDLPEPFGPTITLTPGPNSSRVRSGNDLKPLRVIDFRYTRRACLAVPSFEFLECQLGGLLLGVLLAAARAARRSRSRRSSR